MIICGLDLETTGLEIGKDQVLEMAWVIKDTEKRKHFKARSFFVKPTVGCPDVPISAEIHELTGITVNHLNVGIGLLAVMEEFYGDLQLFEVDTIVAHNGENFDKPFLAAALGADIKFFRTVFEKRQWVDTKADCIYPKFCHSTSLMYLAAYYGFVNPFPHSALFDVMTMLKVLENFDINQVVARAKEPWVVVKAHVSFNDKDLAKARRYMWEKIGEKAYPKSWVKKIKESEFEKEKSEASFPIEKL